MRLVVVKPRNREGSISEKLCRVWVNEAREELVIVYETIKKLCIGSHDQEYYNVNYKDVFFKLLFIPLCYLVTLFMNLIFEYDLVNKRLKNGSNKQRKQ